MMNAISHALKLELRWLGELRQCWVTQEAQVRLPEELAVIEGFVADTLVALRMRGGFLVRVPDGCEASARSPRGWASVTRGRCLTVERRELSLTASIVDGMPQEAWWKRPAAWLSSLVLPIALIAFCSAPAWGDVPRWFEQYANVPLPAGVGCIPIVRPRPRISPREVRFKRPRPLIDPAPMLRTGSLTVAAQGSIDRQAVAKVIDAHLSEVCRCYERGLLTTPGLAGTLVLEWEITRAGTVGRARVTRSSLQSPPVESCVIASLKRWKFPPAHGSSVVATYPFAFRSIGF